jgi:hypothetical protein
MSGVATGAGVTDTQREGEGMCPQEMGGTAEVIHIAIKSAARYNEQGDEMLACLGSQVTNEQHNQRCDTSLTEALLRACCCAQHGISEYLQHLFVTLVGISEYLQQYVMCWHHNIPTTAVSTTNFRLTLCSPSGCLKTAVYPNYCKEVYLNICNGVSE